MTEVSLEFLILFWAAWAIGSIIVVRRGRGG